MSQTIKLIGAPQSPYSRKMRAALRYRQIPYQWIRQGSEASQGHPPIKLASMIPVLWFAHTDAEKDTAMLDSTFQLQHLETLYSQRSLVPSDAVVKFFDGLIEDFADEWLTKAMFHYRWDGEKDIQKAGTILPLEMCWNQPDESVKDMQALFADRQVGRLGVVGSNEVTKPLIEESYQNILSALNSILTQQPFVMGQRPGAADFALYGQLVCLALFDPTPSEKTLVLAPRVYAWVEAMEDTSGELVSEDGWIQRDQLQACWAELLQEIGRTYAPFLLGNAAALQEGLEQVDCTIDGRRWTQKPFPYQGKCLMWQKQAFDSLNAADQEFVLGVMQGTGCEILFS
jgi:glutathione S-transferase